MKVYYKKTIVELIDEAIVKAKEENKIIEKIELNKDEWDKFRRHCYAISCVRFLDVSHDYYSLLVYNGIEIRLENN